MDYHTLTPEESKEIYAHLVQQFKSRMRGVKKLTKQGEITKQYALLQQEFFAGAYSTLDFICGRLDTNEKLGSTIPPIVYFSIIRGEEII